MFALYTAKLLIDFKLQHPQVHSMGTLYVCATRHLISNSLFQVMLGIYSSGLSGGKFFLQEPSFLQSSQPYVYLFIT